MCASFASRSKLTKLKPHNKFPLYKYGREAHFFFIILTINCEYFCICTHWLKGLKDTV